jgi:hypothetical protein
MFRSLKELLHRPVSSARHAVKGIGLGNNFVFSFLGNNFAFLACAVLLFCRESCASSLFCDEHYSVLIEVTLLSYRIDLSSDVRVLDGA